MLIEIADTNNGGNKGSDYMEEDEPCEESYPCMKQKTCETSVTEAGCEDDCGTYCK